MHREVPMCSQSAISPNPSSTRVIHPQNILLSSPDTLLNGNTATDQFADHTSPIHHAPRKLDRNRDSNQRNPGKRGDSIPVFSTAPARPQLLLAHHPNASIRHTSICVWNDGPLLRETP